MRKKMKRRSLALAVSCIVAFGSIGFSLWHTGGFLGNVLAQEPPGWSCNSPIVHAQVSSACSDTGPKNTISWNIESVPPVGSGDTVAYTVIIKSCKAGVVNVDTCDSVDRNRIICQGTTLGPSFSCTDTSPKPGQYYLYDVNVSGTGGCYADGVNNITTTTCAPSLSASCSPKNSSLNVGDVRTFTASPSGGTGSYTYQWTQVTCGGATTNTSQQCTLFFGAAGTYTPTATVTSGSQTATDSCNVNVSAQTGNIYVTVKKDGVEIPSTDVVSVSGSFSGPNNYSQSFSSLPKWYDKVISQQVAGQYQFFRSSGGPAGYTFENITCNPSDCRLTPGGTLTAYYNFKTSAPPPSCNIAGPTSVRVGDHFSVSWSNSVNLQTLVSSGWNGPITCSGPDYPNPANCKAARLSAGGLPACPPESGTCVWGSGVGGVSYLFFQEPGISSVTITARDAAEQQSTCTHSVTATATPVPKYRCSGTSCIRDDVNGTFTDSGCNNTCVSQPQCTFNISPPSDSVQVGGTKKFTALYDQNGPSIPPGDQDVSNAAAWDWNNKSVATHVGSGNFRGDAVGSTGITATYSQCLGKTATATLNVTERPNNPPVINSCDINPKSGNAPLNTNYTSSVSDPDDDPISIYRWNFGFGNTDLGPSGAFTYTNQGTFSVTLQVRDARGAWSSQRACGTVTVGAGNQLPIGSHDANDNASCQVLGWATDPDNKNSKLKIKLYSDGAFVREDSANKHRDDLASAGVCPNGDCAFFTSLSGTSAADGQSHSIRVRALDAQTSEEVNLSGTPKSIQCAQVACTNDSQCNDNNSCTTDRCENPGTANARCTNTVSGTHKQCLGINCEPIPNTAGACTDTCTSNLMCGGGSGTVIIAGRDKNNQPINLVFALTAPSGSQSAQQTGPSGQLTLSNQPVGSYQVSSVANIPSGQVLDKIEPCTPGQLSCSQTLASGQTITFTIRLKIGGGDRTISGRVFNQTTGAGFAGATVTTCRSSPATVNTDNNGNFSFQVTEKEGFCVRVAPETRSGFTGPSTNNNPETQWAKTYEHQVAGWDCETNDGVCAPVQVTWDRALDSGYDFKYTPIAVQTCDTSYPDGQFHACFFDGTNPPAGANPVLAQNNESIVDHDWGFGQVNATGKSDQVSGIWRGRINFPAGNYVFHTLSDDGVNLNLEGFGDIISNWTDHGLTQNDSAQITLPAGSRNVTLKWYENGGGAAVKLWWTYSGGGGCPSAPASITPADGQTVTVTSDPASITLSWAATANTAFYNVRLDDRTDERYHNPAWTSSVCGGSTSASPHYVCENGVYATSLAGVQVRPGKTYAYWVDPIATNPSCPYVNRGGSFSVALETGGGGGGGGGGDDCTPGQIDSCDLPTGCLGGQKTCQADHTWGACVDTLPDDNCPALPPNSPASFTASAGPACNVVNFFWTDDQDDVESYTISCNSEAVNISGLSRSDNCSGSSCSYPFTGAAENTTYTCGITAFRSGIFSTQTPAFPPTTTTIKCPDFGLNFFGELSVVLTTAGTPKDTNNVTIEVTNDGTLFDGNVELSMTSVSGAASAFTVAPHFGATTLVPGQRTTFYATVSGAQPSGTYNGFVNIKGFAPALGIEHTIAIPLKVEVKSPGFKEK